MDWRNQRWIAICLIGSNTILLTITPSLGSLIGLICGGVLYSTHLYLKRKEELSLSLKDKDPFE